MEKKILCLLVLHKAHYTKTLEICLDLSKLGFQMCTLAVTSHKSPKGSLSQGTFKGTSLQKVIAFQFRMKLQIRQSLQSENLLSMYLLTSYMSSQLGDVDMSAWVDILFMHIVVYEVDVSPCFTDEITEAPRD